METEELDLEIEGTEQQHEIRTYRTRLDYLIGRYIAVTDYIQREKNNLWALDQSTKMGNFPREASEHRYIPTIGEDGKPQKGPFQIHKEDLEKALHREMKNHRDYKWIKEWPGVGVVAAAFLLSKVNIEKADTPSKLWKYCGLAPNQKMEKGKTRTYNAKLKSVVLHYIGQMSLLRMEPWRGLYLSSKAHFAAIHPDWTKGHIHNAARRKMVKIYLANLWVRWRTEHDLPVREPYVQEKLGHTGIVTFDPEKEEKFMSVGA